MNIKNYSTKIDVAKTVSEIEAILAKHGVSRISKEYDGRGVIVALFFSVRMPGNFDAPYRLPMDGKAVLKLLERQRAAATNAKARRKIVADEQQAARVGWRILKDWIDAQMALVQVGLAQTAEVFLPYLFDGTRTLYERAHDEGFKFLLAAPKAE